MNRLSKRHFWEWFKRHHQEYRDLKMKSVKEARYWLNELNAHLRAYYKFFGYTMMWENEQIATLIITVKGKGMHFKKVDAFVATAPEIPGWKIVALEEPMPIDFALDHFIEAAGIDPREFYFNLAEDAAHIDLVVYHPLCTRENHDRFFHLAHAAIYNLLGERVFGLELESLVVVNLSDADPDQIHKLEELPDCIGGGKSSMTVGADGRLLF